MPTWNPPAAPPPASNEHYNVAANWTGGVPIATTDAIFDGAVNNRNCIINTAGLTCFNFTIQNNYTGTITFTNTLTVRNNITFQTSVTFAGPNGILYQQTGSNSPTFNSNNKAFNLPFSITQNGYTITFSNTWTVSDFTTNFVSGNPVTYTGGTVNVTGNLTNNQGSSTSTTQFVLTGTGTFSTSAIWCPSTDINTTGVITVGNVALSGGCVFKYTTALSLVATGTVSIANGGTVTLDLNNIPFNNYLSGFNTTVNLLSDANFLNATHGVNGGSGIVLNGVGRRFNVRGNFASNGSTGTLNGTATITLTGTGTISSTTSIGSNLAAVGVDFELNTSGTYTVTSNMSFTSGKTFTRTNGFINWSTFTLSINSNYTLNAVGITFNNINLLAVSITLNSQLTLSGTLKLNGTTTFTGTAGWNTNNFTHGGAGTTCTLQAGITYNVTGLFTMVGTAALRAILQSNDVANVTVSIPALSNQMTVSAGSIPNPAAGYVLGSVAFFTALPAALSNILPDRPTIASGSASPYTLVNPIGVTALTSYAGQVGKKTFFNVNSTTPVNVIYAATRDIDSSGGVTIYATASFPDNNSASPNLYRTLNWATLTPPSGSVYYTWVD